MLLSSFGASALIPDEALSPSAFFLVTARRLALGLVSQMRAWGDAYPAITD